MCIAEDGVRVGEGVGVSVGPPAGEGIVELPIDW